jgi:hypothetical protein
MNGSTPSRTGLIRRGALCCLYAGREDGARLAASDGSNFNLSESGKEFRGRAIAQ